MFEQPLAFSICYATNFGILEAIRFLILIETSFHLPTRVVDIFNSFLNVTLAGLEILKYVFFPGNEYMFSGPIMCDSVDWKHLWID